MRSSPSRMRLSPPSTLKSSSLLLLCAVFVVSFSVLSYLAGLRSATCKLTAAAVIRMPTTSASPVQASPVQANIMLATTTNSPISPGSNAPLGRHILLEYYKIPGHLFAPLTDTRALHRTFIRLIKQAGMTYLGHSCHVFTGSVAVTCVFLLSESHLSIHTWPEHGYAALDIFTCGASARPELIEQGLAELLQPGLVVRGEQARGGLDLSKLTPQQQAAKVLHTFTVNTGDDGENMQQLLYQVAVLHSSASPYQSLKVVDIPGLLGRCLLLDSIIQFCSHDLDAYTDHMARYPLQLLQALHGCGPKCSLDAGSSTAEPGAPGGLLIAKPELPPAGSNSTPGHVTCRASMLWQPVAATGSSAAAASTDDATASNNTATQECQELQQRKLRVLLIGGGDGWIAGHLISCYGGLVESVTAVELDKTVSDVTEKYFGQMMLHGSPFKNARIKWLYTDAYAWATQRVEQCSKTNGSSADAAFNSSTPAAARSVPDGLGTLAPVGHRLSHSSTVNMKDRAHTMRTRGSSSTLECAGFDVVIIDSTDFTVTAASKLHSAPFYSALYKLMNPRAALMQIIQSYLRVYESSFAAMEGALLEGSWVGVGRSTVYSPSYGGESVMLRAVKR